MKQTAEETKKLMDFIYKGEYPIAIASDGGSMKFPPKVFETVVFDFLASYKQELTPLLRETAMRANLAMPENEQDSKWFDEGLDVRVSGNFMERLFKSLDLGEDNPTEK